jgi:putative tryptophan/tyrosine transport system substrate-binding protein
MRRIGVLLGYAEGDPQAQPNLAAFTKALQELGWADGRNIRTDGDRPRAATLSK